MCRGSIRESLEVNCREHIGEALIKTKRRRIAYDRKKKETRKFLVKGDFFMAKYVTFGEVMLRLTPPGHEVLFQTPNLTATFGGAEANVAVSLEAMFQ